MKCKQSQKQLDETNETNMTEYVMAWNKHEMAEIQKNRKMQEMKLQRKWDDFSHWDSIESLIDHC